MPHAEIVACETCGSAERERLGSTRGERLIAQLMAAAPAHASVAVSSTRCLWACARPCAVHLRASGRPGYVLAGFEADAPTAHALLEFASQYAQSEDGSVPYRAWPQAVRGRFLCRIPALANSSQAARAEDEPLPQETP